MQYLYVPYRDQSNIYTYDTTLLQTDSRPVPRSRLPAWIASLRRNAISTGLTTRIL